MFTGKVKRDHRDGAEKVILPANHLLALPQKAASRHGNLFPPLQMTVLYPWFETDRKQGTMMGTQERKLEKRLTHLPCWEVIKFRAQVTKTKCPWRQHIFSRRHLVWDKK